MASWLATGPPVMCCAPPVSVVTSVPSVRFCTTPPTISTIAPTTAIGSRIRSVIRVRSTQKLPSWSVLRAGEAADQRDRHRDADRGRDEVLHGQAGHLAQMGHRRLARVRLPVRVGHEADRGVPGDVVGDRRACPGLATACPAGAGTRRGTGARPPRTRARCGRRRPRSARHSGSTPTDAVDAALDDGVLGAGDHPVHVVAEERYATARATISERMKITPAAVVLIRTAPGTAGPRPGRPPGRRR